MSYVSRLSNRLALRVAGVALIVGAVGCSNEVSPITAPRSASVHANLIGSLLGGLLSSGVKRLVPLPTDVVASIDVGPLGGRLDMPETGLSLMIPAGAVSQPTHMTVTAKAGAGVAYTFEPHGLVFARPLKMTQDLRGTTVSLNLLSPPALGYFAADGDYDPINVVARIVEWEPSLLSILTRQLVADVPHFSGYMVSSDRR